MGNCFTLLFSNNKSVDSDTKMNEKVEREELLQIPSVEVYAQPASSNVSFQSELDLSVGGSCATVDFDADDESSSSGTLLFDSEDECDVSKLQGEALHLPKNHGSWLETQTELSNFTDWAEKTMFSHMHCHRWRGLLLQVSRIENQ